MTKLPSPRMRKVNEHLREVIDAPARARRRLALVIALAAALAVIASTLVLAVTRS